MITHNIITGFTTRILLEFSLSAIYNTTQVTKDLFFFLMYSTAFKNSIL